MRRQLDRLKCDDQQPWTRLSVVKKRGSRALTVVPRARRQLVDRDELFDANQGRQSKRENPYSQVWSFLARFGPQLDAAPIGPYLPADVRRAALQHFRTSVAGLDYNRFTQSLSSVDEFALMVSLAKQYYASVYYLVGLSFSRDAYIGCGQMEKAAAIDAKMATVFQTRTLPHYYAAVAWAKYNGKEVFGVPYGPVIAHAWLAAFLEKSVDRVGQRRGRNTDQRLQVQQRGIDFHQLVQFPEMLPAQLTIDLRPRASVTMPAPLPYALDARRQSGWAQYLTAMQKRLLGSQRFPVQDLYFANRPAVRRPAFRASIHSQNAF
jgi:hypothetical protein